MFQNYKKVFMLLLCGSFAQVACAQSLVHYWSFNALPTGTISNPIAADLSNITGAATSITYTGTGAGYLDNVEGDVLNAQNGAPAGLALRPRNPSDTRSLLISFPTTGYENMIVKFATTKTNQGATEQTYSYSLDGGVTFITTDLPVLSYSPVATNYELVTLDFSGVPGVDNAANVVVRINFGGATAAGSSGNNRFDNLTVTGTPLEGTVVPEPSPAVVSLASDFIVVNENAGTLSFVLNVANPSAGTVDLVLKSAPFSTADSSDFTFVTQTVMLTADGGTTQTVTIPIIDDTIEEQQAEYFVLSLENPVGVSTSGETLATIYIKDNDIQAPAPTQSIALDYVTSFDPSGANDSTCEIVAYDPVSKKLFATSAVEGRLDIVNFTNPEAPVTLNSINMTPYGGVTSVAVKNGIVAVASPNTNEALNGSVVFFTNDGTFISQVTVGALPDNISFTPDGTKVLTANEGQPNADYSVDPEGSVSIIDITGGVANLTNSNVTTLLFDAYNTPAAEALLRASGARKLKLTSTMSQDFEPEYITTSADSQKAWVTLQENNAIAEINLATSTITNVWGLGTKDMSQPGNGFDISDNNGEVLIANWPIQAYYIPDGVASYNVGGTNYIVTANEGDEKEYTGFEERTTIGANSYNLDANEYPQAAMLKKSHNAGRLRVTNLDGLNADGTAYEQIYAVGTRSFSIFNADTKEIVYDSGDDFEMYTSTAPAFSAIFNADSEDNDLKKRSRAKGPEPEGVTIARIADKVFAFIGLERVGGVMVYDVTNPNAVQFVDYANSRNVSAYGGDNGPEGILYINNTESPNDTPYVIVANEISGTLTVFEVNTELLGTGNHNLEPKTFTVFPNPSVNGVVYFNRVADIEVYDYSGKLLQSAKQALTIDTSNMASGIYIVKTSEGIVKKLVIK
jgi:hypothetical protein